jgi:integrase/recombinase XerD
VNFVSVARIPGITRSTIPNPLVYSSRSAPNMNNYLESFQRELKNRNYALNTKRMYVKSLEKFLEFAKGTDFPPEERISKFLEGLQSVEGRRISWNSIKLFYEIVLKKECPYQLDKMRHRRRLPSFLYKDDVLSVLEQIKNPKHKLMISMLFGSGLRVGELVKIRIRDVDFDSLTVRIVNAKQNKDRITVFSEGLVEGLKSLVKGRDPKAHLFQTQNNEMYTKRTVQTVFRRAFDSSGIQKKASCHTLRHSFATALLTNGIDIRSIKDLLGHKSIKTTMIYLHVTERSSKKIKSPL